MAKREINILISAKNTMMRGLNSAHKSLVNFGKRAGKVARYMATRMLAVTAAITAIGVKAVRAFGVQQSAERSAESAFRAYGEEVAENTEKVKKFAAAIQDETGVADENLIARAAQLKMLGVETDALESATKATLALKSAGMGEVQSIRAVAAARNGDFQMLTRYIPALRQANTEAEKAQIVNDFLTRGYQQQKDQLDTVNGRFMEMKGRLGDLWEAIGAAIVQNDGLTSAMARASEKVKEFTSKINEWAEGGGVQRLIVSFQQFFEDVRHNTALMANSFKAVFAGIRGYVDYASGFLEQWLFTVIRNFQNMGRNVQLVWELIKKPSRAAFRALVDHSNEANKELIQNAKDVGKAIADIHKLSDPVKEVLADREKLYERHNQNVTDLAKKAHRALNQIEDEKTSDADDAATERINIASKAADEEGKSMERTARASQRASSALDKFRRLGHDVEELDFSGGAGSSTVGAAGRAISGVRSQAQDRHQAQRNVDLAQKSIHIQEQIRDYLRGNLEAI